MSDDIVDRIEEALGRATRVLVVWSRAAAGSRWVLRERSSALARQLGGAPVEVALVRLDDASVPALSAAEKSVDGRSPHLAADLETWVATSPRRAAPDLRRRILEAEVRREEAIAESLELVEAGEHVVVLVPRRAGAHTLTRQLLLEIRTRHPDWFDVVLAADALPGEAVDAYRDRITGLLRSDGRRKVVALVHGWSRAPVEHQRVFGALLRARAEEAPLERPFRLVALGGHPVYLQKFGVDTHLSLLNRATPVFLDDLDAGACGRLLARIGEGWGPDDAADLARRAGGHPTSPRCCSWPGLGDRRRGSAPRRVPWRRTRPTSSPSAWRWRGMRS